MRRSVWKFPIEITDEQTITAPGGDFAVTLVGRDSTGAPCIWALVDIDAVMTQRRVVVHGTGHPVEEDPSTHVGSFVDGPFVWHVFIS